MPADPSRGGRPMPPALPGTRPPLLCWSAVLDPIQVWFQPVSRVFLKKLGAGLLLRFSRHPLRLLCD